jgi:uncharacterized protein
MTIITLELLTAIKKNYSLNWYGTHGVIHWSRVYENGMKLATQDGVNRKVVQLFSAFHDSQRRNEHWDKNHGKRGAQLALRLRDMCLVSDEEFSLLVTACSLHTTAGDHEDITVKACFDADRLDLGRVGKIPNPDYLCTPLAKTSEMLDDGYTRSLNHQLTVRPFGIDDLKSLG